MSDDNILHISDKVEELAQGLMSLTGKPVAGTMNHILETKLFQMVEKLKLQKICSHNSKHYDRKSGWYCMTCGLELVGYVCPCTNISKTANWGTICRDCGKTIEE